MLQIRKTQVYTSWFDRLRDRQVQNRIDNRLRRLRRGNFGDVKAVGGGVSELRLHFGPGYRVYFVRRGESLVILLSGGDKDSQDVDIRSAQDLAGEL